MAGPGAPFHAAPAMLLCGEPEPVSIQRAGSVPPVGRVATPRNAFDVGKLSSQQEHQRFHPERLEGLTFTFVCATDKKGPKVATVRRAGRQAFRDIAGNSTAGLLAVSLRN
jgi:hypothetical protein